MIGELSRHIRTTPPKEVWREAWAAWKHGVLVILTLFLAFIAVMLSAALIWFALNALPLLLVQGWTFDRSWNAFEWTAILWLPIAYSLGARYLPSYSDEAGSPSS